MNQGESTFTSKFALGEVVWYISRTQYEDWFSIKGDKVERVYFTEDAKGNVQARYCLKHSSGVYMDGSLYGSILEVGEAYVKEYMK